MKKNKVLIVIICVLLLAAGAFGYWFFCLREAPAAPVDAGPVTEEPVDPDTSGEGPVIVDGSGTDLDPNAVFEEVVGGEDAAGTPAELIKKYNITDPMQVTELMMDGTISPNEAYDLFMLFESGAATSSVDMSAAKAEADRINTQYDLDGDGIATLDEMIEGGYYDDKPEEKAAWLAQKEWAETTTWGGPTTSLNDALAYVTPSGKTVGDLPADELEDWLYNQGGIEELRAAGLWD